MSSRYALLAQSFEALDLDAGEFHHVDHVGVAYEMLGKYDFVDAVARYAHNIKTIAARAGAPGKFNTTITVAFLSLIAERMGSGKYADYGDFISQNQDLESKGLLRRWYPSERLQSDLARKVFLLPSATR